MGDFAVYLVPFAITLGVAALFRLRSSLSIFFLFPIVLAEFLITSLSAGFIGGLSEDGASLFMFPLLFVVLFSSLMALNFFLLPRKAKGGR